MASKVNSRIFTSRYIAHSVIICQIADVMICRTRRESIFSKGIFSNRIVNLGIVRIVYGMEPCPGGNDKIIEWDFYFFPRRIRNNLSAVMILGKFTIVRLYALAKAAKIHVKFVQFRKECFLLFTFQVEAYFIEP